MFLKLTKIASRKNLRFFIEKEIQKICSENKKFKIINIGAGGEIEEILKKFSNIEIFNIDIDSARKPDLVYDICDPNIKSELPFVPDIVTVFEVLEHVENPILAVENIYNILEKNSTCLCSVPFNFHIHDEPKDFYRFTYFGLKLLFKKFDTLVIKNRNGWLESIFVNLIRLYKEKNILSKATGILFSVFYIIFYPIIFFLQKIITSNKLTTGYFVVAKK